MSQGESVLTIPPTTLRNKLFTDGVYTFAFRMGNMAFAALMGVVTARILGPHGRGVYALPLLTFSIVTAGYAGINNATSYYMLRRKAGRGVLRPALYTVAVFVAIGIPAALIIARVMGAQWAAVPAILALPAPAILAIFYGYQIGIDRVRMNTSYALLNTAIILAFLLASFQILGHRPEAAIVAWATGSDVFALGALLWLIRDSRRLGMQAVSFREFLGYTMRAGAVSVISLLNYRADVFIVASLGKPALLGMYTLAVTAAEMLLAATQVTAVVSSPQIGGIASTKAAAELTARCVRNNLLIAFFTCAALWVVAPFAVGLLYGAAFLPMIPAFRVLLIGVFALSLGSPMSTYFTIRLGKPQISMILAGLSAAICIIVSLLTVRRFGLVGAALGSTLGYAVGQTVAIATFLRITALAPSRVLMPRWSDITAYGHASSHLLRRMLRVA